MKGKRPEAERLSVITRDEWAQMVCSPRLCLPRAVATITRSLSQHVVGVRCCAVQLPFLLKYQTEPLSRYSDGDAWPVILDEFVEWHNANTLKSKPPQNVKPTDP